MITIRDPKGSPAHGELPAPCRSFGQSDQGGSGCNHPGFEIADVRHPRNAVSYLGHIALQLATNFAED